MVIISYLKITGNRMKVGATTSKFSTGVYICATRYVNPQTICNSGMRSYYDIGPSTVCNGLPIVQLSVALWSS